MDVCMIDVRDIDCKEGEKGIMLGDDVGVRVVWDIVERIGYEMVRRV